MLMKISNIASILKMNRTILFYSKKTYRDVRDTYHYFPDNRYQGGGGGKGNPYKPQFTLSDAERKHNESLPIEDRVLDWDKYMKHTGKLKSTTGTYLIDVEPFPRLKMMMLCDIIMNLLSKLPDTFSYKHLSFEYCKFMMKVIDENENLIEIESKVSETSSCEDIINLLHGEVTLLTTLVDHRPWIEMEKLSSEMNKNSFFFAGAAFRETHPFCNPKETTYKHRKNEKPGRPNTADIHGDNLNV